MASLTCAPLLYRWIPLRETRRYIYVNHIIITYFFISPGVYNQSAVRVTRKARIRNDSEAWRVLS